MSKQIEREMAFQLFEKSEVLKNLNPKLKLRWFNRIDVNSQVPIETQIQELENELSAFHQIAANSQQYAGFPPKKTTNNAESSNELDEIVSEMTGMKKQEPWKM